MMKKRLCSGLLALVMALGLAGPVGLVTPAEAASTSDARAYLDILNRTNPDDSYLIDFDGDGRDELLTVAERWDSSLDWAPSYYSVYQGDRALVTDTMMGIAGAPHCDVVTKNGKTYIADGNASAASSFSDYYTVRGGQWVKDVRLEQGGIGDDWENMVPYYKIDDRDVSEAEYNRAAAFEYQFSICEGRPAGDAGSRLDAIVEAERYENMTPAEILAGIPYIGDRITCQLTSEQAAAYAEKLANLEIKEGQSRPSDDFFYYSDIRAYLCDLEGNGNPALLVDYRIVSDDPGWNWAGEYNVSVYVWNNGQVTSAGEVCWERTYGTASSEVYTSFGKNISGGYSWVEWSREMAGAERYQDVIALRNGRLERVATIATVFNYWDTNTTTVSLDDTVKGTFPIDQDTETIEALENELIKQAGGPVSDEDRPAPMSQAAMRSVLRAYANARRYPAYSYPQADSSDTHYADVTAAVAGQGIIQAVHRLADDLYYVLLENGGTYTGAVVRGLRENGRPVWRVTQTDPEPAAEETLAQLLNRLLSVPNLELDFRKLQGSLTLDGLTEYLRGLLDNIDGLTPNDPAKSDLAAFLEGAVTALASGTASGKDNRLTVTGETVSPLAASARRASDALNGVLRDNGVELNKVLDPSVRVLWSGLDAGAACQITIDNTVAQALGGFALQLLLGDGRTYVRIPADDLSALTRGLGSLSVQIFEESPGVYAVTFLDEKGEVVNQLSRPVTIGLPASGELSTVMVSYAGGSGNWGGQYDAAAGTLSFETSFSGKYEVLENSVAIDDIAGLSDESRAAISFMVSKGYLSVENGLFRPGEPLTRYEFTEALVSMFFALDPSLTTTFPDVPADSPYYPYVASAQARDIVRGLGDGTFSGENNITREQVFALAARTLIDQKGYAQPADVDRYLNGFSDRESISGWAEVQVALAVREGIATRGSALHPQINITREQAAVVLYRLFQRLYEVSPVALDVPEAEPESEAGPGGFPVLAVVIPAVVVVAAAAVAAVLVVKKKKSAAAVAAPAAQALQSAPPAAGPAVPGFCPNCGRPVPPARASARGADMICAKVCHDKFRP